MSSNPLFQQKTKTLGSYVKRCEEFRDFVLAELERGNNVPRVEYWVRNDHLDSSLTSMIENEVLFFDGDKTGINHTMFIIEYSQPPQTLQNSCGGGSCSQ